MSAALRIVVGADEARRTVLRRPEDRLTAPALPDHVRERISDIFGEELSAAEAVARIIEDVRSEGDVAVRRYSQQFDGSSYEVMEVTHDEIEASYEEVS